MELKPVFLDTETTGLGDDAEICDIAVIDFDGVVLFDTLVKPVKPIPEVVSEIHGITNAMVNDAPGFGDIADRLAWLLNGRSDIIIYNALFDRRVLRQSAAVEFNGWIICPATHCAMTEYAAYNGDWNSYRGNYKWVKLETAALHCGIALPAGIHRARVDAELTRQVVKYMATQSSEVNQCTE